MNLRKVILLILKIVGGFLALLVIYFVVVMGISQVTSNAGFEPCEKDAVEIYILTNGVHTDLVLPIRNDQRDWTSYVNPINTKSGNVNVNFVAFGWGDKGFYLNTPTWAELKFSTAFKAMFFLSTTAMHVTFYEQMNEGESCRKICISKESYKKLVDYIDNSFTMQNNSTMLIKGASYGNNDSFYDANGTYSLFFTCNSWTNNGLKVAGLKACAWTLMDKSIFDKYK